MSRYLSDRRRAYVRKRWLRSADSRQPLQQLDELMAIPVGTQVVAYVFQGRNSADATIRRQIAHGLNLGSFITPPRGGRCIVKLGRVGLSTPAFQWRPEFASAAWADATRVVFFDPGDIVLQDISQGHRITMERYLTSRNEPAILAVPTATAYSMQFEAHLDGGFGLEWPTRLDAFTAARRALHALPRPNRGDLALIETDSELLQVATAGLLERLHQVSRYRQPVMVRADVAGAALVWTRGGRTEPGEMSLLAPRFDETAVHALLKASAALPRGFRLGPFLQEARSTLRTAGNDSDREAKA